MSPEDVAALMAELDKFKAEAADYKVGALLSVAAAGRRRLFAVLPDLPALPWTRAQEKFVRSLAEAENMRQRSRTEVSTAQCRGILRPFCR